MKKLKKVEKHQKVEKGQKFENGQKVKKDQKVKFDIFDRLEHFWSNLKFLVKFDIFG